MFDCGIMDSTTNSEVKRMRSSHENQQKILDFIKQEIEMKGYPPSVREICAGVGLKSTSTVHAHLNHLEQQAANSLCETIALEVRVSNEKALRLYRQHDFVIINTKPGYYKDPSGYEDAYFMMKGI